jgi:hypothetical protein
MYADGTALFNVRLKGRVGVLATPAMTPAQAQIIRDVVSDAIMVAEDTAIQKLVREWDDSGKLDAAIHGLTFEGWVRGRAEADAEAVDIGVLEVE